MADKDNKKKPEKPMSLADFLMSFPTVRVLGFIYLGFILEYVISMGLLIFYLKHR